MNPIQFQAVPVTLDAAAGENPQQRTITGIAAPWNTPATVLSGERVQFQRGAFSTDGPRPKLLENHDMTALRGVVNELVDLEEGLGFTASFANTRASQDAIELVKAGAYDSVSVGAIPNKYHYNDAGVMVVTAATLVEISLVAQAAFGNKAPITEIAATVEQPTEADENQTQDESPKEDETMSTQPEQSVETATIPTQPLVVAAAPSKPFRMPSAAEYISKFLQGGAEFAEFAAKIRAAAPDVVTTDTPGLLPEPIVGPVYNSLIGRRSLIDAIGVRAMPMSGKVFLRPVVKTHTSIGASNGENQPLDAGTFEVDSEQVQKAVYGGYVKLSEEDMDWSTPEVLALLIDDMARVYAAQTEEAVENDFDSGITATEALADETSPEDWAAFVWNSSKTILDATTHLPNFLAVSPSYWAALGQLVDDSKRPLFPQVGPMNAFGNVNPQNLNANAFGLPVVVCPHLNDFAAVGNTDGFEIYEQQKGAISAEATDGSLARIVKFRGYLATLMIDADKFVKNS